MIGEHCGYCGEQLAEWGAPSARQCPDCGMYVGPAPPGMRRMRGALMLLAASAAGFLFAWLVFGPLGALRWL